MARRFVSPFRKAGREAALVVQGRVMNVNLTNWTVDVVAKFDRHYYYDIQVSSNYQHFNNGEGIYVMPDVGAVCQVTIPSDSSPPFVSSFVMPMEVVGGTEKPLGDSTDAIVTDFFGDQVADPNQFSGADAPDGTRSRGGAVPYPQVDARFDGGRPAVKPGDIMIRGRDGNFVTLHRGGVLAIGASELAQRIYIPINNKVLDVSGGYAHQNVGGTVHWGMQEGPSVDNPACEHMQVYRLYANDQYCDLRITRARVLNPVGEPVGDGGAEDLRQELKIGTADDDIIVYEVALAPGGFKDMSGDLSTPAARNQTTFRYFFTKKGGVLVRAEASVAFRFKQRLKGQIDDDMELICKKSFIVTAGDEARIQAGPLLELKGDVVKLGAGTTPVARLGDPVAITIPVTQISGTLNGQAFTGSLTIATPVFGAITSGNPNVLA